MEEITDSFYSAELSQMLSDIQTFKTIGLLIVLVISDLTAFSSIVKNPIDVDASIGEFRG